MSRKKVFGMIGAVIAVLFLVAVAGVVFVYSVFLKPNFRAEDGGVYIYARETGDFDYVVRQMEDAGCAVDMESFIRAARMRHADTSLRAGRYKISEGMTNRELVNMLNGGMQTPVKLRINNIRLPGQLARKLGAQLRADSVQFMTLLSDSTFLKRYGVDCRNVLSLFLPDTYEVYWTIEPEALFDRMYREYGRFWDDGRRAKAEVAGLTPLEVSVLASIVDSETNSRREKPTVAGLYINRLRRGIPLQSDPTVKFAVGDFGLNQILYKHLEVESPYNTYKHAGLPPGPICMPTKEGIDAVLNYEKHNYLYMCAKETLDGEHNFAATLSEHNRNAARYHAALRQWMRQNGR